MTHLVRFQIKLGAGIFEHLEVCIFVPFLHRQKKSMSLGSEIMCHIMLRDKNGSIEVKLKCYVFFTEYSNIAMLSPW